MTAYTTWADRVGPTTTILLYVVYADSVGRYVLPRPPVLGLLANFRVGLSEVYSRPVTVAVELNGDTTELGLEIEAGEVEAGSSVSEVAAGEGDAVVITVSAEVDAPTSVEVSGSIDLDPPGAVAPVRYLLRPWRLRDVSGGIASVVVDPDPEEVLVGQTVQLTATALDAGGEAVPDVVFAWSSSAPEVATVSATGLVTGVAEGNSTVRATATNGVYGEVDVAVPEATLHVDLTDDGIDVTGYYVRFADYELDESPAGWTATTGHEAWWSIVNNGTDQFLRMAKPTPSGGGFTSSMRWTAAGDIDGDVEVYFSVRAAHSDEAMRARIWREATSSTLSVAGSLEMLGDLLRVYRNTSIQASSGAGSMPMTDGGRYCLLTRLSGTTMELTGWEAGDPEPGAAMLSHTIASVPTDVGLLALEVLANHGSFSMIDFFEFSFAVGGASAPRDYPAPGWIVPPQGYSVRLSSISAGIRISAGGVESEVVDGVAVISRDEVPETIEILDADGELLLSIDAPANHRSYSVEMYYA